MFELSNQTVLLRGLGELAHELRQDGRLKDLRIVLALLQDLREAVNDWFINQDHEELERTTLRCKKVIGKRGLKDCVRVAAEKANQQENILRMHEEMVLLRSGYKQLSLIVTELHQCEKQPEFHKEISRCAIEMNQQYDLENFAYGSTPYHSFARILTYIPMDIQESMSAQLRNVCIFGSSAGWLVFYACALGYTSEGYEILPCLGKTSLKYRELLSCQDKARCTLHIRDMLEADLSSVGLLVLTSQCWDVQLKQATYEKIARQAPGRTVLLDYGKGFGEWIADPSNSHIREAHALEASPFVVPVSWNPRQRMYVYILE
mmetsp:Transcript_22884/g.36488  ORF Transcript_22884/g.36488 Transcript_22884/m.36488 type:complete len:319 (+) Transcript_22884:260-1216(+)|eukprot:CAMPEP_0203746838 /NCGR_PEP_ID=MMETSP0098-20131031/2164_1 /ASSEMBLY_ACC=CAM_ASM_000208 /TAXON_ID=96639 /ORGANISM=" , Strain NY0313808BC1" /LENGTH=318 /DNA_ID=CAMNT_0050635085 /DNA_START=175 /DNA_END=1131 /DNA_ORIENTATION=+